MITSSDNIPVPIEVDGSTLASTWHVTFRPLKQGFSAWLIYGNDSPVCVSRSRSALTWRKAAEDLHSMADDGLSGDWRRNDITVVGTTGWQAEIIAMAAVTENSPTYQAVELILGISDKEIAWLSARLGCLWSDSSLSVLNLIEAANENRGPKSTLAELLEVIGCTEDSSSDDLNKAGSDLASKRKIEELAETARKEAEPKTIEKFVAARKSLRLKDLNQCARFSPPSSESDIFRLLDAWILTKRKPKGGEWLYVRWASELTWLPWLLQHTDGQTLVRYRLKNASGSLQIETWLQSRAHQIQAELQADAGKKLGQAWGMGQMLKRSFIKFVEHYTTAPQK